MAGYKSKNNPENRNKQSSKYCPKCNTIKKPIVVVHGISAKQKMCSECKCGKYDKSGTKVL